MDWRSSRRFLDKEQHWHTMHSHAHCHNGQCTPRHVYQVWNMPLTTTLQRGGGSSNNNTTTDLHWTQHSLDSIDDQLRSDCSSVDSDCIWSACARCVQIICQVAPIQVRVKTNSKHMHSNHVLVCTLIERERCERDGIMLDHCPRHRVEWS